MSSCYTLNYSPTEPWLCATGEETGVISIVDLSDEYANIFSYQGHDNSIFDISWTCDGKKLVSGSGDLRISFWDAETWISEDYEGHIGSIKCVR